MTDSSTQARTSTPFRMVSDFAPAGDQPQAVAQLAAGLERGDRFQTLLGITGSGKSATIAWTIEQVQRPTLVIAPNKSLAAQLANEFREFFPDNRVEYFVSYYDYYQPEAYMPASDTYIEKDSSVNDEIDRLRHSATSALLTRRDTIVVASVSCIYGLGSPEEYQDQLLVVRVGETHDQRSILRRLVDMQYERNDVNLVRGKFRVRGDTIEVHPAYDETAVRIELFGDDVEAITVVDPLTGERVDSLDELVVFPATHYVAGDERMRVAITRIEAELQERLAWFEGEGKLLEAQRLRMRTQYDLEMMQEVGFCSGIENYSAPIDGRHPGEPPNTLLDFFPDDFLVVLDESHQSVPQLHGQYEGDRSRKETLIDHGFRLPSAADNRPLRFEEFLQRVGQVLFLSATPGPFELEQSAQVVEQVVRPTGLVDPEVIVKPTKGQIDDLIEQINQRVTAGARVLVTTLTKKMAEDLSEYLLELGVKVRYLHSESTRSSASRSSATCGSASSTCWSASTCSVRASTSPRCRSSPSSTPTRRGSSAARRRSSRPSAGRPATSTGRWSCTPTRSPTRCNGRSPRPTGGEACSRPTTPSTASTRSRSARPLPTSSPTSGRRRPRRCRVPTSDRAAATSPAPTSPSCRTTSWPA
jgi:excinuclease ABC subunit B